MTIVAEANGLVAPRSGQTIPEFRIAIVYETQATGTAAMELCQRLMTSFQNMFLFRVIVESFAALEEELRFRKSLRAAAGADMIFVGSAGSLPVPLLRWLKECIAHRGDAPVALVDMTAEDSRDAAAVHRFLNEMARSHHLDLISKESFNIPAGTVGVRSIAHPSNIRHWGINE